jgi:alpha-glucuronidase
MLMRLMAWVFLLSLACSASAALAEDGYDLWLRYRPLPAEWLAAYRPKVSECNFAGHPGLRAGRPSSERR